MIYLHKILPLLVMPLSITLFIIVIGLVRKKPAYCWGALLFIYMCACVCVSVIYVYMYVDVCGTSHRQTDRHGNLQRPCQCGAQS